MMSARHLFQSLTPKIVRVLLFWNSVFIEQAVILKGRIITRGRDRRRGAGRAVRITAPAPAAGGTSEPSLGIVFVSCYSVSPPAAKHRWKCQ